MDQSCAQRTIGPSLSVELARKLADHIENRVSDVRFNMHQWLDKYGEPPCGCVIGNGILAGLLDEFGLYLEDGDDGRCGLRIRNAAYQSMFPEDKRIGDAADSRIQDPGMLAWVLNISEYDAKQLFFQAPTDAYNSRAVRVQRLRDWADRLEKRTA